MEKLSDIEADIRERADCAERNGEGTTHNDGVALLLRSIADRMCEARKDDERLMLKLLDFAIEDYYDDWASDDFRNTVKSACSRLGIEYCTRGWGIEEQVAAKVAEIDNSARIMCKLDTAHRCVDCELCKGEGGGDGNA